MGGACCLSGLLSHIAASLSWSDGGRSQPATRPQRGARHRERVRHQAHCRIPACRIPAHGRYPSPRTRVRAPCRRPRPCRPSSQQRLIPHPRSAVSVPRRPTLRPFVPHRRPCDVLSLLRNALPPLCDSPSHSGAHRKRFATRCPSRGPYGVLFRDEASQRRNGWTRNGTTRRKECRPHRIGSRLVANSRSEDFEGRKQEHLFP